MKRMSCVLVMLPCLLAGCSTAPMSLIAPLAVADSPEDEAVVREAITEANQTCSEVIGTKERLADARSKSTLWISLAGLTAGSVIAPALVSANAAANAAWISAFSGAGGAANMATRAIDGAGYSGAADATTINGISEKVKAHMTIALNRTKTYQDRYNAAIAAQVECLYYPRHVYQVQEPAANTDAGAGAGNDTGG